MIASTFLWITFSEDSPYARFEESGWSSYFSSVEDIPLPSDSVTLLRFSLHRSSWSPLSFSSLTFKNVLDISGPFPQVPTLQLHTQLSSQYGIPAISCLEFKSTLLVQIPHSIAAFATEILNLYGFHLIGSHQSKHNNKNNTIITLCQVPKGRVIFRIICR